MTLYFDTADRYQITVKLISAENRVLEKKAAQGLSSQALLTAIASVMQEAGLNFSQIKAIEFFKGPGSYTGLKVGATVANILGWLLKIPVNGQKNRIVLPDYE